MEYIALKEVCRINMGQSPESSSYNDTGDGIPFFQGNADFGERYPVTRIWCNAPTKIAEAGDILISVRAPIGALNYASEQCCIGRGLAALTPDQTKISSEFVYWLLKGKNAELNSKGTGSTFKAIGRKVLEETLVPNMGFEQQHACAMNLDKVYSIIQLRKQELQNMDALIKARFVEMFGDCTESVSAGVIMSEMRNGVSPSTSGKCPEKVLTLSAITQGNFDPSMWKDGLFHNPSPAEKRIHATDFYMCRGNGNKSLVGAGVYSKEDREDLVFPDTVIAARVDVTKICLPYLFIAWMQPRVRDQIEAGARTTNGTYKINQQIISKINVPLPPLDAQEQFSAFVAQVDKSKFEVQRSLDETQKLFDSLMQQYFG